MQNAHYGRIVAVLALMFWLAVTIIAYADLYDWTAMGGALIGITVVLALWALGAALASLQRGRLARLGDAILWPSLFVLLVLLGIEQTLEIASNGEPQLLALACGAIALALVLATVAYARRGLALVDLIAVAVIALGALAFSLCPPDGDLPRRLAGGILVMIAALWAVYQGQSGTHRVGKAFGLAAFGIETIHLYVVTLGTMMNTALAFLGGGVLFIVLAAALYQIDRRLTARHGPGDVAEPPPSAPPAPPEPPAPPSSPPPPPLAMADDEGGADAYAPPPLADDRGDDDADRAAKKDDDGDRR